MISKVKLISYSQCDLSKEFDYDTIIDLQGLVA